MASHVVEIYEAMRNQCLIPAQAGLDVNYIDLADYYRLGPELSDRIARMGKQKGLNAVIVSPLSPEESSADASHRLRKVVQPYEVFFIWKRTDTDLKDAIEKYADPLHDVLCAEQVRRLGNLKLHDASGNKVGHVTAVDVSVPDMDPPDNADLYPNLACCSIRVEISYVTTRDYETQVRRING